MRHCWKSHVAAHLFCKLILLYCGVHTLPTIEEKETKHMDIHLELPNLKDASKKTLCTGLTEFLKHCSKCFYMQ